jgi:uncharacterized protein (DUF885 family)
MRRFLIALLLAGSAPAAAAPADDLKRLLDEHWAWTMRENPVFATLVGVRDHEGRVPDVSLARPTGGRARRRLCWRGWRRSRRPG